MSTKKEILDYIRHTPGNSNVNVLSSMLNGFADGGGNVPPPGSGDDGKFLRANNGEWEVVDYPLIDSSITILDTTITVSNQELTPLGIPNENFENWIVKINGTQTTWIEEVEVPMWGLMDGQSMTAVADATVMDRGVVLVAEASGTYHIEITLNNVEVDQNFITTTKQVIDEWSPIEGGDIILFDDAALQQAGESVQIYSISTSQAQQEWPPFDPDTPIDVYFAIYANDVKLIYDEEYHMWRNQNFEVAVHIESDENVTAFFLDTPDDITPQDWQITIMIPQSITVKTNFQTGVENVFYTSAKIVQDQQGTQESMNNKYDWGISK